jgi:hypothetical protein
MTKIIEKNTKSHVHSHIDAAYDKIAGSLPTNYVQRVQEKLKGLSISDGTIRNVKNRINQYPTTRIKVLNALVEVAIEYQKEVENLTETLKK